RGEARDEIARAGAGGVRAAAAVPLRRLLASVWEADLSGPCRGRYTPGRSGESMSNPTIPISEAAYKALCELAQRTGHPPQAILDQAIEDYRRKVFFESLNAGYAALRADPQAWAEELAERKAWDATLMDGLDPDERWSADGRSIPPGEREK